MGGWPFPWVFDCVLGSFAERGEEWTIVKNLVEGIGHMGPIGPMLGIGWGGEKNGRVENKRLPHPAKKG